MPGTRAKATTPLKSIGSPSHPQLLKQASELGDDHRSGGFNSKPRRSYGRRLTQTGHINLKRHLPSLEVNRPASDEIVPAGTHERRVLVAPAFNSNQLAPPFRDFGMGGSAQLALHGLHALVDAPMLLRDLDQVGNPPSGDRGDENDQGDAGPAPALQGTPDGGRESDDKGEAGQHEEPAAGFDPIDDEGGHP